MKRTVELSGLRKKKLEELVVAAQEATAEHFKHVLSLRAQQLKETHMVGQTRRQVARIKTVFNEKARALRAEQSRG